MIKRLAERAFVPLGRRLRNRRPDEALSVTRAQELITDQAIELRSDTFGNGEVIPDRCCGFLIGSDTSPHLTWGRLPENTEALLLIIEDVDTPTREPAIHTAVVFAADRRELAEGELVPGRRFSFLHHRPGRARYFGPRPIPGHGAHRYRFHLYALDSRIRLGGLRRVDQLPAAVAGHVLAAGMLEGTRTAP
ncbi:YbhB/YbcL family Raf kinase inhibitor-like protein [Microlunatus sp. Gsoil 973]|uniref:YbhB/YbcL family Raf kinase inhibitor-like protein n=1 Tax=Microlunatus sp. Gsoil 973 TaxID=2672569 RepID=UPI0012B4D68F|nr:YbhB/YbcL family Raf kinase inhibitor-like protein [Microlunatus sp. Gsoil 973]QGN33850.1 YbhB/YbcL family Raf kinase inhibitor-like protein [Microlunatus sp. Gsoil 973]